MDYADHARILLSHSPPSEITTEDGSELEARPCKPDLDVPKCPPPNVHYFWSAWGPWGDCEGFKGECGGWGTRERAKVCMSTRPNTKQARRCPGEPTMSEKCEGLCYKGRFYSFLYLHLI